MQPDALIVEAEDVFRDARLAADRRVPDAMGPAGGGVRGWIVRDVGAGPWVCRLRAYEEDVSGERYRRGRQTWLPPLDAASQWPLAVTGPSRSMCR
jgi:hypothetical protein